jgi:hypothetical protein
MSLKVISFKVQSKTYNNLKKIINTKNKTFRDVFEPIAIQLANGEDRTAYTSVYRDISSDRYQDLISIQKTIDKILKSYDNDRGG